MDIFSLIIVIIALLNCVFLLLIALIEREKPELALFWLLCSLLLPIVGFIIYFFIGCTQKAFLLPKKHRMSEAEKEHLTPLCRFAEKEAAKASAFSDDKSLNGMVSLHSKLDGGFYPGNKIELLCEGETFFSSMFKDIEAAKESIYIEFFIIRSKNETGKKLISLLAKKAAAGVQVMVLYDTSGCFQTKKRDFKPISDHGGAVLQYQPSFKNSLLHLSYRLHRKIIVVDHEIAYTGGMNIADDYLGSDPKLSPWRDTFIRITGSSVCALEARLLSDVNYVRLNASAKKKNNIPKIGGEHYKKKLQETAKGSADIQVVWDGPDRMVKPVRDSFLKMIYSAQKYLYIQTPYFVPGKEIRRALRTATQSGVDVRLMLPGVPDHKGVYNLSQANGRILQKYGVKVYLHKGFLHAKSIVFDDLVSSIGTANVDFVSFYYNYEVNAVIYDKDFAALCRETFFNDMKACNELATKPPKGLGYSFWRLIASIL